MRKRARVGYGYKSCSVRTTPVDTDQISGRLTIVEKQLGLVRMQTDLAGGAALELDHVKAKARDL